MTNRIGQTDHTVLENYRAVNRASDNVIRCAHVSPRCFDFASCNAAKTRLQVVI